MASRTLSSGLVPHKFADDITQRRLGQLLQGVGKIVDFIHRLFCIHNLEIEQRVDFSGHVVFRNHLLGREVVDLLPRVVWVLLKDSPHSC